MPDLLQSLKLPDLNLIYCYSLLFTFFNNRDEIEGIDKAMRYEKNKDYKSALLIYNKLIKESPNEEDNYIARANCELEMDDSKSAILDCEKAISINSNEGATYYLYAQALYNEAKYDEACKAIKKSVELGFTSSIEEFCE